MAKFPESPGVAVLQGLAPALITLPAGTALARVYFADGVRRLGWNGLRFFGPLDSRWDHHLPDGADAPQSQSRGILYAALDAKTCLAEVFQHTRRIDRTGRSPRLVVFETVQPLNVLDLSGGFCTRMGASMAIHSGNRARARRWARDLYDAYQDVQAIRYGSSMHAGAAAFAINERALAAGVMPRHPHVHRALNDDLLLDALKRAACELGYALV